MKKFDNILKARGQPDPQWFYRIGCAYWVNGFKEKAEYYFNTSLEQLNSLIDLDRYSYRAIVTYYHLAAIYAFLGEKDKAYENLRLINQKQRMPEWMAPSLENDAMFDNIRDEPEFQQIVRDIEVKYQAEHERVRKWLEENNML
jgi:hypothetical protein